MLCVTAAWKDTTYEGGRTDLLRLPSFRKRTFAMSGIIHNPHIGSQASRNQARPVTQSI